MKIFSILYSSFFLLDWHLDCCQHGIFFFINFPFNLYVPSYLKWVSSRQHIVGSCLNPLWQFLSYILLDVFRPLMFKVAVGTVRLISAVFVIVFILLFLFFVYVFCLPLILSAFVVSFSVLCYSTFFSYISVIFIFKFFFVVSQNLCTLQLI